jgi:hypothetical protein
MRTSHYRGRQKAAVTNDELYYRGLIYKDIDAMVEYLCRHQRRQDWHRRIERSAENRADKS